MIIYIGSRRQTYVLRTMRRDERMPRWTCRTYSWLFRTRRLPAATYVFLGVDRLDAGERHLAAQFYRHINAQSRSDFRALNDPAIAMGRFRLLRTLHEAGINDFNAYLVTETARPSRYPVFIRRNSQSTVPLTELIASPVELGREIDRLIAAGEPAEDLLVIELHAEPVREGIYRKQAEYRVLDRYVPSPSIYAAAWYVKVSNTISVARDVIEFDESVMDGNPYAELAKRAFEIAGIQYGRADIGIVGGRPQVYEINFNPDMRSQRERPNADPLLRALWDRSDALMFAAMREIDPPHGTTVPTLTTPELTAFRLRFWRNYAPQRY